MSVILAIANLAALLFAVVLWNSLDRNFRLLFISSMLSPMVIWLAIAMASYQDRAWGLVEIFMMVFRGSFMVGVFTGALACYIVTQFKKRGG